MDGDGGLARSGPARLRRFLAERPGYFDAAWYMLTHATHLRAGETPLEHYLERGAWAGLAPNAWFDPEGYAAQVRLRRPLEGSPLEDYAVRGWREGLQPSAAFDTLRYLAAHPEVAAAWTEPLLDHLIRGRDAGREAFPRDAGGASAFTPETLRKFRRPDPDRRETVPPPGVPFDPASLRIDWVIPDFIRGAGGHMAIFKAVWWLERLGHRLTVWIDYPNVRGDIDDVRDDMLRLFQSVKAPVRFLRPGDRAETDVLVVTDRWTVWARPHFTAKAVFYFVQDYEPNFFAKGSEEMLAAETYRQGIPCICTSSWLSGLMRAAGSDAVDFVYPADRHAYFEAPRPPRSPGAPPRIALYGRLYTPRRAVELAVAGLAELRAQGVEFVVDVFGQAFDEAAAWPFPVALHGILNERDMGELFRRADVGLAFSTTNYSITNVEMMACGLAVVDLDGPNTRDVYPTGAIRLVAPFPRAIAAGVKAILDDPAARDAQVAAASAWAGRSTWSAAADLMVARFRRGLEAGGAVAAPAVRRTAIKACVLLEPGTPPAVRAAVERQSAPFPWSVAEGEDPGDASHVVLLRSGAEPMGDAWLYDLVGLAAEVPACGLAHGRREPAAEADPFTVRDARLWFDGLRRSGAVFAGAADEAALAALDDRILAFPKRRELVNACLTRELYEIARPSAREVDAGDVLRRAEARELRTVHVYASAVRCAPEPLDDATLGAWAGEEVRRAAPGLRGVAVEAVRRGLAGRLRRALAADVLFGLRNGLPPERIERRLAVDLLYMDAVALAATGSPLSPEVEPPPRGGWAERGGP